MQPSSPHRPDPSWRRRLPFQPTEEGVPLGAFAQFGLALCLLCLEVSLTGFVLIAWFAATFRIGGADPPPDTSAVGYLTAIALVGVGAGVVAVSQGRRRAWGVAVSQGLMAALLTCGALVGLAYEARDAAPQQPPPAPGMVGCRSGDHSQECAHLGG
ncbi:DUF6234 family protein [Streptomyces albidoflavus]|uniref:DUF6234 family protein n=1 Tax=Streptomyces albidoflavus TaxID=1886 RepID=UPI0033CDB5D3